jgi:two-component system OmpR family sensor kinase
MNGTEPNGGGVAAPPRRGPLRRLVWNLPLGWQLTALYTVLLVVTLAVVGALVYSNQEGFLVNDAAERLEQAAVQIIQRPARVPNDGAGPLGGGPGEGQHGGDGPGRGNGGQASLLPDLIRGLSGRDVAVAILDTQGTVITSTPSLLTGDSAPLVDPVTPEQAAAVVAANAPRHWIARRADGSRQVVVLQPITLPAPTTGTPTTLLLEQSASLAAADAALQQLGLYLLLGVLGGTLAGVLLGTAFTRGVLRPLDRVAGTAEAIAGGDLERRLRLPPGRNEVARLGQAFDYMVSRLVASLEAQRRFVADASHELRTPLTSLTGLAEILMIGAHGNDSRVIEQSARAIHDELNRLSRLVNDLLTLSRLDSTRDDSGPPARRVRMDACATLTGAAQQMRALAEGRTVRLTAECAAPLWVVGDPGQVKQVLLNLIDNALRYTPAGGAVRLRGAVEDGMARIEVQDSGAGIAADELPHIFERFYRGDASRSRATGNSGLGLAIARAIIEAHGGTIAVRSAPGSGTCFTLRLPLAPGPAPAPDAAGPLEAVR